MNKEDMKKYFYGFSKEAFVEKTPDFKLDTQNVNALKFVAKKIYKGYIDFKFWFRLNWSLFDYIDWSLFFKGYIDDPRNTDNSWIEAEIWNFHFGNEDKFDNLIPNVIYNLSFLNSGILIYF